MCITLTEPMRIPSKLRDLGAARCGRAQWTRARAHAVRSLSMTTTRLAVLGALCAMASCVYIADVRDRVLEPPGTAGGGGAEGGMGGGGADGGGGGEGGAPMCDAPVPCYEGPSATRDVGACADGEQPCVDGLLGACEGQVLPTVESCDAAEDLDCDGDGTCYGDHQWSMRFGDGGIQVGRAVALDSQGNILVAGVFDGVVDFGGEQLSADGGQNIFVLKLSPDGVVSWARRFGQGANQNLEPTRIAVDANDRVVVAGTFVGSMQIASDALSAVNGDGYVFVLDAAGTPQWGRQVSGPATERVRDVATDPTTGDIVVAGWAGADATIEGITHSNATGYTQMFVARYEEDGQRAWSNAYVGPADVYAGGVEIAPNGDVVVVGYIEGATSLGGASLTALGNRSFVAARYDAAGNHRFSAAYGTAGASNGNAMAMGPNGETYVLVRLANAGAIDIDVATLSTAGAGVALVELEEDLDGVRGRVYDAVDAFGGIAVDAGGFVTLSLRYDSVVDLGLGDVPVPGGDDFGVLKLVPTLDQTLWVRTAGAAGDDEATALAVDEVGRAFVVGKFSDSVSFGGSPLDSAGASDVFVVRYDP